MAFILIAEDNPAILESLAAALRAVGHMVETAPDGRAALKAYRRSRHDLVITDIFMPELDGIETIMALRQIRSSLSIIAMSDVAKPEDQTYLDAARFLGAARTLKKPVASGVVIATVAELLEGTGGSAGESGT